MKETTWIQICCYTISVAKDLTLHNTSLISWETKNYLTGTVVELQED